MQHPPGYLMREDVGIVGEGLYLDRVSCRVEEEHRPLLADLAGESKVGLYDEIDVAFFEAVRELVKLHDAEEHAKVGDRDVVIVDAVVCSRLDAIDQVGNDLVPIEVPVHPNL